MYNCYHHVYHFAIFIANRMDCGIETCLHGTDRLCFQGKGYTIYFSVLTGTSMYSKSSLIGIALRSPHAYSGSV